MLSVPLGPIAVPLPGLELVSPFSCVQFSAAIPWEIFDPVLEKLRACRAQSRIARRLPPRGPHRAVPLLPDPLVAAAPSPKLAETGRKPWPLQGMLAAFLLRPTQRVEDKISDVHFLLSQNMAFAAACGFRFPNVPSYRSLVRFDAQMRQLDLWAQVRILAVRHNIQAGLLAPDPVAIVDTIHIEAEATVGKTHPGPDGNPVPTDDHVGVLAKSRSRTFIAHKADMLRLAGCVAPVTAIDLPGATPDAHTLRPALEKLKAEFHELALAVHDVAADGIYQTADNRQAVPEILGRPDARLVSPIHPGRTQPKPLDRRGMRCLDAYGIPVCVAGHRLLLQGRDLKTKDYIWHCPAFGGTHPNPKVVCAAATHQACCDGSDKGRTVRTPRELSPHINWDLPQPGAAFKKIYGLRPRIEGSFGILTEVFLIRRLHQRGAVAGQAHLDRSLASMHLWLFARHVLHQHAATLAA